MSSNTSKVFLGILSAVFGLMALYFGVKYGQMAQAKEDVVIEKQEVDNEYNEIKAQYELLTAEFDAIEQKNVELDGKLTSNLADVDAKKAEVARLLRKNRLTQKELDQARGLINQLKAEKDNLLINVQMLTAENMELKSTNDTLRKNVVTITEAKLQLEQDTTLLIAERNEVAAERDVLAPVADYGTVVKVRSIYAEGVKYKKSGKEKETNRGKRVDKIKVCFDLEANPVSEAGEKEYLVRLISPEGVAIYEEQQGSGIFTSKETDEQMKYTTKTYVNYENEQKSVCLYWTQNTAFAKGNYHAEIYNNGYKVGDQNFELK